MKPALFMRTDAVKSNEARRTMKILLVDPCSETQEKITTLFSSDTGCVDSRFGYQVEVATDKHSSIRKFESFHPDLIFISLELGSEAKKICEVIRSLESERHTGLIFLGLDEKFSDQSAVEYLELGADDVIKFDSSDREILARTNAVLRLKAMTDELRSANHKLHQLSYTDELTGLDNMRAFNGKYARAIQECQQGRTGLGVIMIDLDNFKNVNDSTNHLMGSHVLSEVGRLIKGANILGQDDCAARFGGDEYIIFTYDDAQEILQRKAEAIRTLVQKAIFIKDGKSIRITSSAGACWVSPGYQGKAEDPIKAADAMLYFSKNQGRNKVNTIVLRKPSDLDQLTEDASCDEELPEEDGFAKIYHL